MLERLLSNSPLGIILDTAEKHNEVVYRYLHDFVRMMYQPYGNDPEKEYKVWNILI